MVILRGPGSELRIFRSLDSQFGDCEECANI